MPLVLERYNAASILSCSIITFCLSLANQIRDQFQNGLLKTDDSYTGEIELLKIATQAEMHINDLDLKNSAHLIKSTPGSVIQFSGNTDLDQIFSVQSPQLFNDVNFEFNFGVLDPRQSMEYSGSDFAI